MCSVQFQVPHNPRISIVETVHMSASVSRWAVRPSVHASSGVVKSWALSEVDYGVCDLGQISWSTTLHHTAEHDAKLRDSLRKVLGKHRSTLVLFQVGSSRLQ